MNHSICSEYRFENTANNTVYRIDTESQPYIFMIYKSDWPEDGKLLFVDSKLSEYGIPHAKILVYSRDNSDFPHGYLIEECLPGITADRLTLSQDETVEIYKKLGSLVSKLHKIKLTGYGYTGSRIAQWISFTEFMYDSLKDNTANLLERHLTYDVELEAVGREV